MSCWSLPTFFMPARQLLSLSTRFNPWGLEFALLCLPCHWDLDVGIWSCLVWDLIFNFAVMGGPIRNLKFQMVSLSESLEYMGSSTTARNDHRNEQSSVGGLKNVAGSTITNTQKIPDGKPILSAYLTDTHTLLMISSKTPHSSPSAIGCPCRPHPMSSTRQSLMRMMPGKVPGPDNLLFEVFMHGSSELTNHLVLLTLKIWGS